MLHVDGISVRRPSTALALSRQHAAGGATSVGDWRDTRIAPRVMVPKVVRCATLGIGIYLQSPSQPLRRRALMVSSSALSKIEIQRASGCAVRRTVRSRLSQIVALRSGNSKNFGRTAERLKAATKDASGTIFSLVHAFHPEAGCSVPLNPL